MTVYTKAELHATASGRHSLGLAPGLPVKEGWHAAGALTVFVHGKPYNFKSEGHGSHDTLMKHRRLVKAWRTKTCNRLFPFAFAGSRDYPWPWRVTEPKRVTFTVYSWNAFDSDGREVACSASRDALKDMQLVTDDRDSAQNQFSYEQVVSRKKGAALGIAIRIELASREPSADGVAPS